MNNRKKTVTLPTLTLRSEYFHCPKCGWMYPGPLLIKGDVAPNTKCEKCGHSYLVRKK